MEVASLITGDFTLCKTQSVIPQGFQGEADGIRFSYGADMGEATSHHIGHWGHGFRPSRVGACVAHDWGWC